MNWRQYPFIRLLLPFVLGIVLAFFAVPFSGFLRSSLLLLLLLTALLVLAWRQQAFRRRWLFGLVAYSFFLTLGYQLAYTWDDWNRAGHFRQQLQPEGNLAIGRITTLQDKGEHWEARLEMEGVKDGKEKWQHCQGRILAYLEKDSLVSPKTGDRLLFTGQIRRIAPPDNPAVFDFARYMRVQNIYFQTFLRVGNWRILSVPSGGDPLSVWMARQQERGIGLLREHLTDAAAFGVGAALVLGHRGGLDAQTKEAYSQTGAMHVLAVSGLHVGLVALFLNLMLRRILFRSRYAKLFGLLVQVAGIWGFALLTGASPSVLRAACMFTMLLLGVHLKRYSNIYNTLAASAFLLLAVRPFMLMELGFQLSYLAVLGIVYFQPKLYHLWYIRLPLGQWVWKLVCVSLAAQITTMPISLFYFHQVPVYFWLSGLVVVPAAMIILPLGLVVLAMGKFPLLAFVPGKLLLWTITAVNTAVATIQQLPGHMIHGVWITGFTLAALYLLITCIVFRLETGQSRWAWLAMGLIFFIGLQNLWQQWSSVNQRRIVFYRINQHTALDFIDGRMSYTLVDDELVPEELEKVNQRFRWSQRIKQIRLHRLEMDTAVWENNWMYQDNFVQFYGLRLVVLDEPIPRLDQPIQVDYLLLRGNPELDIPTLLQSFNPGQLVFDASNHRRTVDRWKADCREFQLPFYDLNEKGALIVDLERKS